MTIQPNFFYDKTPYVWTNKFTPANTILHSRWLWWLRHLESLVWVNLKDSISSEKFRKTEQGPLDQPIRFEIINWFLATFSFLCFTSSGARCSVGLFPEQRIRETWCQKILESAEVTTTAKMWQNRENGKSLLLLAGTSKVQELYAYIILEKTFKKV